MVKNGTNKDISHDLINKKGKDIFITRQATKTFRGYRVFRAFLQT